MCASLPFSTPDRDTTHHTLKAAWEKPETCLGYVWAGRGDRGGAETICAVFLGCPAGTDSVGYRGPKPLLLHRVASWQSPSQSWVTSSGQSWPGHIGSAKGAMSLFLTLCSCPQIAP